MESTEMIRLLNRWKNARRAFYAKDYRYVDDVIAIVERYPEHMYRGFATPLEAACFAVLVELVRRVEEKRCPVPALAASDSRHVPGEGRNRAHVYE